MSNARVKPNRGRRSLFWRLWLRSLTVKRPQAALAIGSVLVGATVASILLNLYGDVRRKMTQEFRAYGPNLVLAPAVLNGADPTGISVTSASRSAPPRPPSDFEPATSVMDESEMERLRPFVQRGTAAVPVLYVVTRLWKSPSPGNGRTSREDPENVVAVGTDFGALRRLYPSWRIRGSEDSAGATSCVVGSHVASRLRLRPGDSIKLETLERGARQEGAARQSYRIGGVLSTGASEDDQVFVPLASLQQLGGLEGRISLVELSVPGDAAEVERVLGELKQTLRGDPSIEVRPIRQIVYSVGKVLDTIRWLMFSLTGLILVIIVLCVMATMTAIVLERRKDIAVMKSLGASDRLVMQLFLTEGATLGMIGGMLGFGLGLGLAREMARSLFSVGLSPAWWTFPLVWFASMLVAVLATLLPVEMIRGIQPARVLRGE